MINPITSDLYWETLGVLIVVYILAPLFSRKAYKSLHRSFEDWYCYLMAIVVGWVILGLVLVVWFIPVAVAVYYEISTYRFGDRSKTIYNRTRAAIREWAQEDKV